MPSVFKASGRWGLFTQVAVNGPMEKNNNK